ncbi:aldehyde ferredoxin oxidoreductase C-terminal domain-containing protein [Chloroflexota bacterium]
MILFTKDTGGLVLKTGDFDSYTKLLDKWINREDIGEYMAQGWLALSERVGVDASTDAEDGASIEMAASHNWWKFDLAISYTLLPSQSTRLSNQYFL